MLITGEAVLEWGGRKYLGNLGTSQFCREPKTALGKRKKEMDLLGGDYFRSEHLICVIVFLALT